MNRKVLNWHKENIEQSSFKVEEYFAHADAEDKHALTLYGILKALIMATGFILDEIEKNGNKERVNVNEVLDVLIPRIKGELNE